MNTAKTFLVEKFNALKAWSEKYEIHKHLRMLAFCAIAFIWTYLMTGSSKVALTYLICAVILSIANFLISKREKDVDKPRARNTLRIVLLALASVAAFCVTVYITDALVATISTVTWLFICFTHHKAKKISEWTLGALLPLILFFLSEYLQNNLEMARRYVFQAVGIIRIGYMFGMLVIVFITCFFANLFNNKKIAYYITGAIFGILGFTNFFVFALTEQPFTISDMKIATTAAGVLKTQALTFKDWVHFAIGLIILAAYFVIVAFAYKFEKMRDSFRSRIIPYISTCLIAAILFFASSTLGTSLLLYQGHIKYGFIGNFYITLNNKLQLPADAKDYVIKDESDEGDYNPNVIIIMNEAFSDLGAALDIELSEDPLPYFHSLQNQYPNGITYSSVKGNNTCSSEWELLSGSPTALTAKGAMIYKDFDKPMRSIVSLFNSRGYTTLGLHPYYSYGYNRNNMYYNLGFDQITFMEDMPSNLDTHRGFITDEENYKYLIQKYEENEAAGDSPFFCFNITMQNHGGYQNMQDDAVYVKGDKTYADVNTYLSGLRLSDEALKVLFEYFEGVDEDTVILIFGDHQPMIDTVFYEDVFGKNYSDLTFEELKKVYSLPYLIWANYDLNEDAAPKETSNCYLTNILFEVGNIRKSTWLGMVDGYQDAYPIITTVFAVDSQNTLWETPVLLNDKKKLADDLLIKYQKYSYGILYGIK